MNSGKNLIVNPNTVRHFRIFPFRVYPSHKSSISFPYFYSKLQRKTTGYSPALFITSYKRNLMQTHQLLLFALCFFYVVHCFAMKSTSASSWQAGAEWREQTIYFPEILTLIHNQAWIIPYHCRNNVLIQVPRHTVQGTGPATISWQTHTHTHTHTHKHTETCA